MIKYLSALKEPYRIFLIRSNARLSCSLKMSSKFNFDTEFFMIGFFFFFKDKELPTIYLHSETKLYVSKVATNHLLVVS